MTFSSPGSRRYITLIVIILTAFIIRIRSLDVNPLWFDEAMEFWVATAPLDGLFSAVKEALQDPPLYSFLLHFWLQLGRSEFILRLLSTYATLLAVAAAFALGKQAHSRGAGILAALFLAILPPPIRFAQEVGQYALLLFTLFINLLSLSSVRRTNEGKFWLLWLITGVMGAYNYYGSLLIILPTAGLILLASVFKRQKAFFVRQLGAAFVFFIFILPLLIFWLPEQLFRGPTRNAFRLSFDSLTAEWVAFLTRTKGVLAYQFTGYLAQPALWAALQGGAAVLLLLLLLFSLYGLTQSRRHAYILAWLLMSWGVHYLAGRLGLYPYGGTRHALILTPLLIVAAAIGTAVLWRWRRGLGLAVVGLVMAVAVLAPAEGPEDLRTVVDYYRAERQAQTPTYVYYSAVPAFGYQLSLKEEREVARPALWYRDCWAGEPQPYCAQDHIFYGRWIRALSPDEKVDEILATVGAAEREFWLVFSHTEPGEQEEVWHGFQEMYEMVDGVEAVGASAYLLQKR